MPDHYVIIEKKLPTGETGEPARASVIEADFKKHYPDVKYKVLGPETVEDFTVTGIPKQKAARKSPRAKGAPKAAPAPIAATEPTGEAV